jgi:excisionase family DNA binding protein
MLKDQWNLWHRKCKIILMPLNKKYYKESIIMDKEILTIEEAAAYLQIGKRSIYKLVKDGKIPGKKVLNKWRFEKESLREWVSKGEKAAM